jgi:predicted ester cyclase
MIRVKTQFHVDRPATEVFDFWTDVRNELRYNPSAIRVEKTTDGPVGLGTAWACEYRGMGPLTLSVVEYDRPRRAVRRGRARAFDFASFLTFEPTATGTHVTAEGDLAFRGPFRLLAPLLTPRLHREFARTMATFKDAAERAANASGAHKDLIRQFLDAWNARDLERAYAFLDPGIVDHEAPPGTAPGREAVRQRHALLLDALPDARIVIEDLLAEDDRVAGRFSLHGTHSGPLMNLAPTGRRVRVEIIDINRIAGGRIVERWGQTDTLALLQQLSTPPAMPGAATQPEAVA